MLIRASDKFERAFGCIRTERQPGRAGPFLGWYAETFVVRGYGRFAVFTDEHTLFSYLVPTAGGKTLAEVMKGFHGTMDQFFEKMGLPGRPPREDVEFVKRGDRRVIGSQNELIFMACSHLQDNLPPLTDELFVELHDAMNDCPLSYLDMRSPRAAMWEAVRTLKGGEKDR